jgi:hypothetical protein
MIDPLWNWSLLNIPPVRVHKHEYEYESGYELRHDYGHGHGNGHGLRTGAAIGESYLILA